MKDSDRKILGACVAVTFMASAAVAQEATVRMQMASAYPTAASLIGPAAGELAARIASLSGGSIEIENFAPGALLPPAEYFDSIASGALDAAYVDSLPWMGRDIAFSMYTNIPFGPGAPEYLAWMRYGGGQQLFEELYASYGIVPILCGFLSPEGGGWYREPIDSVADFDGLRYRIGGLGGNVMRNLGVAVQQLSGGDVLQALQLGTIDGAEFSMPSIDRSLGFQSVARYYYFPGWQSQSSFTSLLVSQAKWNEMSAAQQGAVRASCEMTMLDMIAKGEYEQALAMTALSEAGVEFMQYSPEVLAALEEQWQLVAAEQAEASENFRRAWESYTAFREQYALWGELGYLR